MHSSPVKTRRVATHDTWIHKGTIGMNDYPLIADHGLIGDLQTSALVATDGSIDSFCAPRFDSPRTFAALLDHEDGGRFRVRPTRPSPISPSSNSDHAGPTARSSVGDRLGRLNDSERKALCPTTPWSTPP